MSDDKRAKRRQTIITLLEHWDDFQQPASSGRQSADADGGAVLLLTSMAEHRSVVELGRVLASMRSSAPVHYGHLLAWFGAEARLVDRPAKRRDHRGRMVDTVERRRERIMPWSLRSVPACRESSCCEAGRLPRTVCDAVAFCCVLFDGEPELPMALHRGLTGGLREFTDQDGTHLTEAA